MNETAMNQIRRALDLRRRDILAHQWADMAVALAMEQMLKEDRPERDPRRFAHDAASLAATILVEQLITKDQAVATLTAERDDYKTRLEALLLTAPFAGVLSNITGKDQLP